MTTTQTTTVPASVPATYFDHAARQRRAASDSVEAAIRCPRCKRSMHRLDCGWTCMTCPPTVRIVDDTLIACGWDALQFLARRSRWMQRVGVDQVGKPAEHRWPLSPDRKREANAARKARVREEG